KARLLPGFVAPSCQALAASRLHRSCWWVDGLAAGKSSPRAEASGAAFGETADLLAASGFALRGIRLEARKPADKAPGPDARANEAEPTNGHGNRRRASEKPQPSGGETLLPLLREDLLAALENAPAILLLNPFATPPLTAEELALLCQRQAPTELLLTISTAQLEYLAAQGLAGQPAPAPRQQEQIAAPVPALTALLRSDTWKALWAGPGKRADNVRRTLEMLRGMLKAHFLYVCVATLDDLPTNAPRRLLLFASRQYASVERLNDFLCAEQARLARERETRALQGNWFARRRETARAAAWAALKEELHTLGRLRRARLWPDLKPLLVLDHFGQFSAAEHDAALLELLRDGRLACRWSPAADADAATPAERVPGSQDFLEFLEAHPRPVWRR
ncbi:MAG TPA: hypothetical protein VH590_03460, partial [Ktedonobacterales bacterium]